MNDDLSDLRRRAGITEEFRQWAVDYLFDIHVFYMDEQGNREKDREIKDRGFQDVAFFIKQEMDWAVENKPDSQVLFGIRAHRRDV